MASLVAAAWGTTKAYNVRVESDQKGRGEGARQPGKVAQDGAMRLTCARTIVVEKGSVITAFDHFVQRFSARKP